MTDSSGRIMMTAGDCCIEDDSDAAAAVGRRLVRSSGGAADPSANHNPFFGGSFQFIVQEQAKSMVAIQELQQEVGSLLLFRQAVLAALPHLHQSAGSVVTKSSTTTSSGGGGYLMNSGGSSSSGSDSNNSHPHHHHRPPGQSWTRRKQEQQAGRYPSLTAANDGAAEEQESSPSSPSTDQGAGVVVPVGHQTRTANGSATGLVSSQQHHNGGVADSGFSTEASNSNTSPRSSRFETGGSSTNGAHLLLSDPAPPMEKELIQHLERVQQRLARLKKDEERLLTLLNSSRSGPAPARHLPTGFNSTAFSSSSRYGTTPIRHPSGSVGGIGVHHGQLEASSSGPEEAEDELWQLLQEIQSAAVALHHQSRAEEPQKDPANAISVAVAGSRAERQQQPSALPRRKLFSSEKTKKEEDERGFLTPPPDGSSSSRTVAASAPPAAGRGAGSSGGSRRQQLDRATVSAVLRLTNPVQLQRSLLRALLDIQALKEEAETLRSESTARDAQLRAGSRAAIEQLTAIKDENEDLRFQLEEQKIELEGTKARLRMQQQLPSSVPRPSPSATLVRVRAASTQTDYPAVTPPCRVIDASLKTRKISNSDGSWATEEENRPNSGAGGSTADLRRTSLGNGSRIPTPIKPAGSPISSIISKTGFPIRRELPPDPGSSNILRKTSLPARTYHMTSSNNSTPPASALTPSAKVRIKMLTSTGNSARLRARLGLSDSLSSTEDQVPPATNINKSERSSTTDDLYDSISTPASHHLHQRTMIKGNSNRNLAGSPYSPLDSLERSLPSVGINYHYRSSKRSSSYASSAGSSTTPSNSLPYHP